MCSAEYFLDDCDDDTIGVALIQILWASMRERRPRRLSRGWQDFMSFAPLHRDAQETLHDERDIKTEARKNKRIEIIGPSLIRTTHNAVY